jgi:hypothetical protein
VSVFDPDVKVCRRDEISGGEATWPCRAREPGVCSPYRPSDGNEHEAGDHGRDG